MLNQIAIGIVLGALAPQSSIHPVIDAAKELRAIVEQMELEAAPMAPVQWDVPLSMRSTREVVVESAAGPVLKLDPRLSPVLLVEEQ